MKKTNNEVNKFVSQAVIPVKNSFAALQGEREFSFQTKVGVAPNNNDGVGVHDTTSSSYSKVQETPYDDMEMEVEEGEVEVTDEVVIEDGIVDQLNRELKENSGKNKAGSVHQQDETGIEDMRSRREDVAKDPNVEKNIIKDVESKQGPSNMNQFALTNARQEKGVRNVPANPGKGKQKSR
ncbi:hypothetical protein FRX31_004365 [Thalictrum thalictroides]|uniref:Uncharacterized protein n=1 Tax=Thalictrum thalictroides TaxID=46969 RepID=A0A7J6XAN3_THATH|nr:hypothetical protein FRX31_004365 [Thalictrum thalictroides]